MRAVRMAIWTSGEPVSVACVFDPFLFYLTVSHTNDSVNFILFCHIHKCHFPFGIITGQA